MQETLLPMLNTVLVLLATLITVYAVRFLNTKIASLEELTENETAARYIDEVADAVATAVLFVGQTYVNALKAGNAFDKEAQKEALNKAIAAARTTLSMEATRFLESTHA